MFEYNYAKISKICINGKRGPLLVRQPPVLYKIYCRHYQKLYRNRRRQRNNGCAYAIGVALYLYYIIRYTAPGHRRACLCGRSKPKTFWQQNDDDFSISRKARNIFIWGRKCTNGIYICFYYEFMWVMAKSSVGMWGKPIGKMHAKAIHYLPNATDSQQTHNIIAHIRMMRRPPFARPFPIPIPHYVTSRFPSSPIVPPLPLPHL